MPAETRIDVHHHFYPPRYRELLLGGDAFPGVRQWTVARTIEEMDRHGVSTAILSLSPPGPRLPDRDETRALARLCNEHGAQMRRDHRARFGLFASLPMPDVEGALAEIAYALDVLEADGIQLMTSYDDKWPGDPAFDPVFQELNRRKALVFVHPLAPACCANLMAWVPAALAEFTFDTTRTILSLMFSGTLDRLPGIRFIFCHGGGTIPMLANRIKHSGSNRPVIGRVPKGIDHELRKLHYDIALAAWRPSMLALLDYIPVPQILLGSDFPFSSIGVSVDGLSAMKLAEGDARAILGANAQRLIPRLAT